MQSCFLGRCAIHITDIFQIRLYKTLAEGFVYYELLETDVM
jgi:hypothetical protein